MFENIFGTTTVTKPKTDNLFGNIFTAKKEIPIDSGIRTVGLPEHLGGGQYKVGKPGELIKTPRGYGNMSTQEQQERDHIISVALGGTSPENDPNSRENLQYLKTTEAGRQEGKVSVEQATINDYLDDKITLGQARLKIATKNQQILGLTPTDKEQTTIGQLWPATKEMFGNIFSGIKKGLEYIKPVEEDIIKDEKWDKYGVSMTKYGDMAVRNPQTGEITYVDTIGGVGRMKDVAKEGLDALGKYLLKSIKAKNLSVEIGQEVVENISKQVKRLPDTIVKETSIIAETETEAIAKRFNVEERKVMEDFIDNTRGVKQIIGDKKLDLDFKAQKLAEDFKLDTTATDKKLANQFEELFTKQKQEFKDIQNAKGVTPSTITVQISKAKASGKSFDEFIKGQGETLYHGTIEKSALSIEKEGFKFRKGKVGAENSITKKLVGDVIYFADTPKATKGFARTEFMVEPSIVEISSSNLNIAGLNDIKKGLSGIEKINYLKAKGFDGLKTGSNDIAIWNIDKIKTKSQLKQLWDKGGLLADQRGTAELPKFMVTAAESIAPIKHQDETVQSLFKNWTRKLLKSEQTANEYIKKIPKVSDDFDTILKYESGAGTKHSDVIKKEFDKLYEVAKKNDIDIPYKENYIPQVYNNSTKEVMEAMSKYMADQGVDTKVVEDYLTGIKELPEIISNRLKLNPNFSKKRAFPSYKVAMEYGLTPKYKQPSQLLANYKLDLEKTIANKKFLDNLASEGKIVSVYKAGGDFQAVNLPFSPKGYYAKPKLAKLLNGMFRNEEMLGLTETGFKAGATLSKTMQEIVLSAGIPFTNINFFTIGQLVKNLTAGETKAAMAFIRSNFNSTSIKYFQKNAPYLEKMANQGIDIVKNVARYDDVYKKFKDVKGLSDKIGYVWNKMFEEKTFKSFIPQMQVETFKGVYDNALKKMKPEEAEKFAAKTTKAFYGLFENVGRGKGTEDVISSAFFAPKFREGIIMTLFNTGKSVTTEIFNPAFRKNRNLIAGMLLGYGSYNALNKKLSGHYMWENPPGKEFDLMIPTEQGVEGDDVVYMPFMPSFLAFARNMASGAIATVKGDISTAKQKFGSLFSMPVKLLAEIWANKDYFGREIYDPEAEKKTQAKQIAGYVFGFSDKGASGGINHPFVRETFNQIFTEKPLYQSMAEAMEMPLKFSTMSKIEKQKFYDAIRKKQAEEKKIKDDFKPRYEEVKGLLDAGNIEKATELTEEMTTEEYSLYKSYKRSDKARVKIDDEVKVFDKFNQVQQLIINGDIEGATAITQGMTDDEYSAYKRLKNKLQ